MFNKTKVIENITVEKKFLLFKYNVYYNRKNISEGLYCNYHKNNDLALNNIAITILGLFLDESYLDYYKQSFIDSFLLSDIVKKKLLFLNQI